MSSFHADSSQHEYQDSQSNFNKDNTVLTTCNKQNPATFNPEKFQPVEIKAEEVRRALSHVLFCCCGCIDLLCPCLNSFSRVMRCVPLTPDSITCALGATTR